MLFTVKVIRTVNELAKRNKQCFCFYNKQVDVTTSKYFGVNKTTV